jgi:hypothetical protein
VFKASCRRRWAEVVVLAPEGTGFGAGKRGLIFSAGLVVAGFGAWVSRGLSGSWGSCARRSSSGIRGFNDARGSCGETVILGFVMGNSASRSESEQKTISRSRISE